MGLIKPNNYHTEEMKFSTIAKALGHLARNRIIELLLSNKFIRNVDLSDYLNLCPASVTEHLNFLRKVNLIKCHYFVHYDVLSIEFETLEYFTEHLGKWKP